PRLVKSMSGLGFPAASVVCPRFSVNSMDGFSAPATNIFGAWEAGEFWARSPAAMQMMQTSGSSRRRGLGMVCFRNAGLLPRKIYLAALSGNCIVFRLHIDQLLQTVTSCPGNE